MFKLLTARSMGLGAACLLAWSVPSDAFQITQINNQTVIPGAGTYFGRYVDFAGTTVAGHFAEPTGTFGGVAGLKYHRIALANYGNGAANCYEVWTSGITTPHPDTRIWFRPNSGMPAMVSINDDAGGTVHPKVRVYLQGQDAHVDLDIASFDTRPAYNTGHFTLNVAKIPLGEVACTSGQATLGWVKHIQAVGGAITQTWQSR